MTVGGNHGAGTSQEPRGSCNFSFCPASAEKSNLRVYLALRRTHKTTCNHLQTQPHTHTHAPTYPHTHKERQSVVNRRPDAAAATWTRTNNPMTPLITGTNTSSNRGNDAGRYSEEKVRVKRGGEHS